MISLVAIANNLFHSENRNGLYNLSLVLEPSDFLPRDKKISSIDRVYYQAYEAYCLFKRSHVVKEDYLFQRHVKGLDVVGVVDVKEHIAGLAHLYDVIRGVSSFEFDEPFFEFSSDGQTKFVYHDHNGLYLR